MVFVDVQRIRMCRFIADRLFQAEQRNGTVYEVRIGGDAYFDCQVTLECVNYVIQK